MAYYPPAPVPYQPYQAPTAANPIAFQGSIDPRKLGTNQRAEVAGQGDALQANDANLANQYGAQSAGTQAYLNPIENTLATGGGGYTPDQASQIELSGADKSQIELSPEEKQNIVTGAGISAGAGTASSVGAAERAAAAAGGNPAALATYRARAAETQGAQAGDAMTQARVQAKQAEATGATTAQQLQSAGAANVGQAAIGQQNQALGYYGGLQGQQNNASLAEQGLEQGAYGTETQGTQAAAQLGLQASQTPSTLDKVAGGVAGAASAATGLADGTAGYGDGMDAVLGENGPEVIVQGASDPVRSDTKFMDDGGAVPGDINAGLGPGGGLMGSGAGTAMDPTGQMTVKGPSIGSRILNNYLGASQAQSAAPAVKPAWNPTTPWSQLGSAIGGIANKVANGSGGGGAGLYADGVMVPYRARMMADGGGSAQPVSPDIPMPGPGKSPATPAYTPQGPPAPIGKIMRTVYTPQGPPAPMERIMRRMTREDRTAPNLNTDDPGAPGQSMGGTTVTHGPWKPMADGGFPSDAGLPKAPTFNPNLITSPTRVHLDPGDKVVPLSYRPQAKIRPSAALSKGGLANIRMAPRLRETYGASRAV